MEKATTIKVLPSASLVGTRGALLFGGLALALLAALHGLSPEFDPSWRMVSEYALGDYGWLLALLFLSWALSSTSLFVALRPHVQMTAGRIGLGFLLASAAGGSMAALFNVNHSLHGLATLIGIPSLPIAAVLISAGLVRHQGWPRALLFIAHLTWMSLALMFVALAIGLSQSGGQFTPEVPIGWPNRIVMIAYCGWVMFAAWLAVRQDR